VKPTFYRAFIAGAFLLLVASVASATETSSADKRVAVDPSPNPWYDVVLKGKTGYPNSFMFRDIFVMGGEDLNKWPYIEHSDSEASGNIQGINLVIPDRSRFGWRFITRVSEVPYNAAVRATIDAYGNGIFTGYVNAPKLFAGAAGSYTPAALVWGNRLGGEQLSTLFSSDARSVQGVVATVFGISYAGNAAVFAQDAYGNVGIAGDATARNVNAKASVAATTVKVDGVSITAGAGAPSSNCSAGDLYLRKGGGRGATVFTCAQDNTWIALNAGSSTPPVRSSEAAPASTPVIAQASFNERSLDGASSSTDLGTVQATLGTSNGVENRWYVCALVEANTLQTAHGSDGSMLDIGIGTPNAGSGTPFRMYSRPDTDTNKSALGSTIVSDWLAQPTGTATGRYCNSYPSGAAVSFTAYASSPARAGAVYTSGQIEIQALPQ
jgi:hypothetical protein